MILYSSFVNKFFNTSLFFLLSYNFSFHFIILYHLKSIEKRKATILRKRANKLIRQQLYKKKEELEGDNIFTERNRIK